MKCHRHIWIRSAVWLVVVLFSATLMVTALAESALLRGSERSNMIHMANGTAQTPYVHRLLLPVISNSMERVTPRAIQLKLSIWGRKIASLAPVREIVKYSHWPYFEAGMYKPRNATRITWMVAMMFASLIAYCLALNSLSRDLFTGRQWLPEFSMLLGLVPATVLVDHDFKLYDFPSMAFVAWGLYFLYHQRWRNYFIVFALACLNKESAILLTLVCGVYYWNRLPRKELFELLTIQLILWAGIFWTVAAIYEHNYGSYMVHVWTLLAREVIDLQLSSLAVLWMICWLLASRWQELPVFVKCTTVMIAANAGIYFVFGMLDEYRVFYDSVPVFALIAAYSLYRLVMPRQASS